MRFLVPLVCAATLLVQVPVPVRAADCPPEAEQQALGFVEAFRAMRRSSVTVHYHNAVEVERIAGIHSIEAHRGVLLVRDWSGRTQALDAMRVVRLAAQ